MKYLKFLARKFCLLSVLVFGAYLTSPLVQPRFPLAVSAAEAQTQAGNSAASGSAVVSGPGASGAPQAEPHQPGFTEVLFKMMPMFFMVFFIFYFMVIKPQQAKLKAQQELLQGLKRGDAVVTTGGMIAKVSSIESDHVVLEIAPNVKVRFEPANVAKRFEKPSADKEKAVA